MVDCCMTELHSSVHATQWNINQQLHGDVGTDLDYFAVVGAAPGAAAAADPRSRAACAAPRPKPCA